MIWRRVKVHSNSTITDLHYIVQIVMGWTDSQATFSDERFADRFSARKLSREASPEKLAHLHRFVIHGKDYGIAQSGGIWLTDDPNKVKLADGKASERTVPVPIWRCDRIRVKTCKMTIKALLRASLRIGFFLISRTAERTKPMFERGNRLTAMPTPFA